MALAIILVPAPGCKKEKPAKEDSKDNFKDNSKDSSKDRSEEDPKEGVPHSPKSRTNGDPDRAMDPASRPAEGAGKTLSAKDGTITVTLPTGDGWDCVDQQGKSPGGHSASLVKCRRKDTQEFYFLMAKVYNVGKDDIKPAKELATQTFMATYEKLFSSHRIVKQGPATLGALQGYEIRLEMTHPRMGDLKKTERVFIKDAQVFVLSGEGKAEVKARFEKDLNAWFENTRFQALAD